MHALQFARKSVASDLLKSLKSIRKTAGEVRDMDVMAELCSSLEHEANNASMNAPPVQFLEYLGQRRAKAAARLHKTVVAVQQGVRESLKQCIKLIEDAIGSSTANLSESQQASINSMAVSLQLEVQLRDWPKLTAGNLHSYRLKVKELRYILQLTESSDSKFVEALGKVKDQIGVWHDWSELAKTAEHVLDDKDAYQLGQIQQRAKTEFVKALDVANAMRAAYLNDAAARNAGKKRPPVRLNASAIGATSRLTG